MLLSRAGIPPAAVGHLCNCLPSSSLRLAARSGWNNGRVSGLAAGISAIGGFALRGAPGGQLGNKRSGKGMMK